MSELETFCCSTLNGLYIGFVLGVSNFKWEPEPISFGTWRLSMVEHHVTKHLENLFVQKAGKSYLGSVHLTLILAHTNWILHSFSDPPTRSTNRNLFSN